MPPGALARGWTSYEGIPLLLSLSWGDKSDARTTLSEPPPPRQDWRPFSLKPAAHVLFAALTLVLIGGLETVINISRTKGAVTFVSGRAVDMAFDYGPLLLAVVYGLIWAAIDHDIKR